MRSYKYQKGVSLISILFVGALLLAAVVYGKDFVMVPYTKYKAEQMLSSLARMDPSNSDKAVMERWDAMVRYEGVESIFTSDNLEVDRENGVLKLRLAYRHCAYIAGTYEFCQEQDIVE